jgi:DNA-binding XRE family transcriptional regulator
VVDVAHRRWADIKRDHLTPERIEKVTKEVAIASHEIRLRQLREMLNKTQVELAGTLGKTQESLSKSESRSDWLVSTLMEYVEALGGRLRLYAEINGTLFPLEMPAQSVIDDAAKQPPKRASRQARR